MNGQNESSIGKAKQRPRDSMVDENGPIKATRQLDAQNSTKILTIGVNSDKLKTQGMVVGYVSLI